MRLFRRRAADPPEPLWRIGPPRAPTDSEKWLIRELATLGIDSSAEWVDDLTVSDMNDGGMGSLTLHPGGVFVAWDERARGGVRAAAQIELRDADGTLVSALLNLDAQGEPFEVDVLVIPTHENRNVGDYRTMERILDHRWPADER